jgi:hypothetical protein
MDTKERWERCEVLAPKLGITKGQVFNFLSVLDERGLTEKILADDQDAIADALRIDRYGGPRRVTRTDWPEPRTALEAKAQDIKVMLWAISKIGDRERAQAAFDAVMRTLTE